jgi:PAS domain S-box-containing protein
MKMKKDRAMKQAIPRSEEAPPDASVETPVDMSVSTPVADTFSHSDEVFPIVGIGASAGGLEALELFLANVPACSGMAFVIVQHMDPTHKGMLPELLQRITGMQVFQVKDQTRVKPDSVYVIPPNKDMSILHGVLHLLDPVARRGLRLPINFFFRSLADDQREHSIGVILSGMGSDGTLGLRAIKEKAGLVFVQEPASAKFDSMPRSAIDAELADVIAPVEALPGKISAYVQHVPLIAKPGRLGKYAAESALEKVALLLRSQTGHDFSLYKKTTVHRRIERRMGLHKISKIATYVRFLQENPQEVELLFRELLIGVTSFFRDPEAWKQLKAEVLPALLSGCTFNQPLRAWIPACSDGAEAYSLAILFKEILEELKHAKNITLQIFATDLDRQAIEKAREGVFPANIAADISKKRLNRFFVKMERGYQVAKVIREMVIFAPQNIIMDPPFTKLALISCRNLLIYLMPELQKKLFQLFHYSLNPGGFLFLGNAETVGNFTNLFAPLAGNTRLYRRRDSILTTELIEFPATFVPAAPAKPLKPTTSLQTLADQLLLQTYSPAAVLTNDKGVIFYISGRTGKYLEPAAGKANWNIFAMAREGLNYGLTGAFQKALRQKETVTLKNVGANGGKQRVNFTIQPLSGPSALHGMVMVVFTDVAGEPKTKTTGKPRGDTAHVAELGQELEYAYQEVQSLREERQVSQEELKSANEELQSANEELHIVNSELQTRMDELSRTNNDMNNLLDSTDIATLFLDNSLCVRRFTSETSKVTKLIPGDAGRPITDIASALLYPELADDAREVLRTLVKVERQIPIPDGNWFAARILPYRTLDNMIDGIVITFVDITEIKRTEELLRKANELHRLAVVVRDAHDSITVQDMDGRIIAWNPGAVKMYGWSETEALVMNVRDRIPEGLREETLAKLNQLSRAEILKPYRTQRITKDGNVVEVWMTSTALVNEAGQMYAIATTERTRESKLGQTMEVHNDQ